MMPGWRTFKFSPQVDTAAWGNSVPAHSCPYLQTKLVCSNIFDQKWMFFLSVCSLALAHGTFLSLITAQCQQLSDPTWSKSSSFMFQGCVNSQDDWQGWQPGYQPEHSSWQMMRELQRDKDGQQGDIFLWTGSLYPLWSQERARNNPRLGSCHLFQILISFKTKKFKYKLTWCWDPKPQLGKTHLFCCFKHKKSLYIFL